MTRSASPFDQNVGMDTEQVNRRQGAERAQRARRGRPTRELDGGRSSSCRARNPANASTWDMPLEVAPIIEERGPVLTSVYIEHGPAADGTFSRIRGSSLTADSFERASWHRSTKDGDQAGFSRQLRPRCATPHFDMLEWGAADRRSRCRACPRKRNDNDFAYDETSLQNTYVCAFNSGNGAQFCRVRKLRAPRTSASFDPPSPGEVGHRITRSNPNRGPAHPWHCRLTGSATAGRSPPTWSAAI